MTKLTDVLQHWLQGEINTAVSGHDSRLVQLESRIEALAYLIDQRDKEIAQLKNSVQALLVPQSMDRDLLLERLRESENWHEALADGYDNSMFEDAVKDVVSGRDLKELVKDIVNDLRFDVSVR